MKKTKLISALLCILMLTGCAQNVAGTNAAESSVAQAETEASSSDESSPAAETSGSGAASEYTASYGSSYLDTGNLTEEGSGYEGIEGTGDFNYGEALQMSLLFSY